MAVMAIEPPCTRDDAEVRTRGDADDGRRVGKDAGLRHAAPPDKMQPREVRPLDALHKPALFANADRTPECDLALLDRNALRRHSGPKDRSEVWLAVTPEMHMDDADLESNVRFADVREDRNRR
jgi:hypothetical protein